MSIKVIMPQMGESIFEGTVTKWFKKIGDQVTRDEPLFEISTDKVDSEIPSPASGILGDILVSEGQTVKISTVVAIIDESRGETASTEPPAMVEQESAAPPASGPDTIEATPLLTPSLATEEAKAAPIDAGRAAAVPAALPQEPEEAPQQAVVDAALPETQPPALPAEGAAPIMETRPEIIEIPPIAPQPGIIRTSPLVRRMAREFGIDLSEIRGTGLSGRITKGDIFGYLDKLQAKGVRPTVAPPPVPLPDEKSLDAGQPPERVPVEEPLQRDQAAQPSAAAVLDASGAPAQREQAPSAAAEIAALSDETEIVPMTPMRKAIAERMVNSRRTSAHVQTVFEVDMTSIVQLYEKHKDEFEARQGYKLSYTPFFVKALVETVRSFPILNSSVSDDKIILKKSINVGLAVALDTGLIVPVIKEAQRLSFTELAHAIRDLAERARTKKLKPEEVQQGTITISNPGVFGSLFGTPIINQPQVAILGVGSLEKRPVILNDAIAIRTMVYLVLSFDHRVIDGAVADQFMAALKSKLQAWNQWVE